jgi:hypothetical protein
LGLWGNGTLKADDINDSPSGGSGHRSTGEVEVSSHPDRIRSGWVVSLRTARARRMRINEGGWGRDGRLDFALKNPAGRTDGASL